MYMLGFNTVAISHINNKKMCGRCARTKKRWLYNEVTVRRGSNALQLDF